MKLIDKDALVAEIEKRIKEHHSGYQVCLKDMLSFINTLEVKEVDLDFQRFAKEMDTVFALPSSKTENTEENPFNWEFAIAKHFYSLGLAQKGE